MNAYLVVNRNSKELETVIFSGEGGDVVSMFTSQDRAEKYIEQAGWTNEFTVAVLEPIELLEWLIQCHRNGVRYLTTNLDRNEQDAGAPIDTVELDSYLRQFGDHIVTEA